jgi:hypothetical protein
MGLTGRARGWATAALTLATIVACCFLTATSTAGAAVIIDHGRPSLKISRVGDGSGVSTFSFRQRASADGFWTRERMLSARSADFNDPASSFDLPDLGADASASAATGDFTPGKVTEFPQRVQGRVFFFLGSTAYGCSGTLVDSAKGNVVFTAGHCLWDQDEKRQVDRLAFVPGYENGNAPFGVFNAVGGAVPDQWTKSGNDSYDLAAVSLDTAIQKTLGARQIAFDLNPMATEKKGREYTIYGYPSKPNPPFNGETLQACQSAFAGFDTSDGNLVPYPIGASPCSMEEGSSGGGWIALGNYLNSVVSHGRCEEDAELCGTLFGPYFSNAAKSLYVELGGSPKPKAKIKKAPPKVVRKRSVRFTFTGSAATPIGFLCKLDRQKVKTCSSKISIDHLRPIKHTLRVWVVDQTGNKSKKPAMRSFRVIARK